MEADCPRIHDPKQGVDQAAVYQLMACSQLYDRPRMTLLYPYRHELGRVSDHQTYAIGRPDGSSTFTVAVVGVASRASGVKAALVDIVTMMLNLPDIGGRASLAV